MMPLSIKFDEYEISIKRVNCLPKLEEPPDTSSLKKILPSRQTQTSLVDAILAEYHVLRNEIDLYHNHQKQIMNFTVLLIAALISAPFTVNITNVIKDYTSIFLVFSPIFVIFGLIFADITVRILRIADYLHNCVRKKLQQHLGEDVWRWEKYKKINRVFNPTIAHLLDRVRWSVFLLPSIISIALFFYYHIGKIWQLVEISLLIVDIIMVILLFALIVLIQETGGVEEKDIIVMDD